MNKYPKYKPSEIEWMGDIPEHWLLSKVKFKYYIGRGRVISNEDLVDNGQYPVFSSQTLNNGCLGFIDTFDFDESLITWTTDGANAGTVFLREGKFNCTNVCGTLKPKTSQFSIRFDTYFLKYATQFYKRPDTNGAKIMNNEMAVIWSLIPPLTEQNQIAAYLDYKTNHIDTLITNKEKLIGLLKEERTAIINQAVTKGINPNAKLKPSGIEWLGDVPQNWEVTRLKRIIDDIFLGLTSKVDYVDNENLGVPLIRAGNLFGGKLDLTDLRYISFEQHKTLTKYRKVKKGDVLVTKSGSIGVCAILESDGEFSLYESVFAIRPTKEKLSSTYLLLLLNSQFLKEQYLSEMVGMGVSHLNMSDMKNTFIFLPNINEQTEIIDYVEFEKKRIDTIITKTEQEIELMKEYKTALISEVVTGKVDVRDEVIE